MITIISTVITFIIDQLTKEYIQKNLRVGNTQYICRDIFKLKLTKNKGLMLGKLEHQPHMVKWINIIAAIVLFVLVLPLSFSKKVFLIEKLGLGFLTGGAMGNLYDRLKNGEVTDFFAFKWRPSIFFNLADIFIFMGTICVFIGELFRK